MSNSNNNPPVYIIILRIVGIIIAVAFVIWLLDQFFFAAIIGVGTLYSIGGLLLGKK